MSDISELERRLAAALERIGQALDQGGSVQSALDDEKVANAALEERVRALKERQDTQVAKLTARAESHQEQLLKLDAELQQLRASNVQLREMNTKLRQAITDGLSSELYDAAVAAEVDALAAQRSADAAEVDAILAELKPLIAEADHATS